MGYALCRRPLTIANCSRIADSCHLGKRILGFFGTQACHLACLVPPLWRLGGPWDDPGTLGGTRKDTLRSRLRFYWFSKNLGAPVWKFFGYLGPNNVHFVMLVPRFLFLMIFGSVFGSLGLETKHLASEALQETTFTWVGVPMILWSTFHDFG